MASGNFQVGDLSAVIGDNNADGEHRAGYSGVWSLEHAKSAARRSLFVPAYAGLNFEHIISGEGEHERDVFFEPRTSPMTFHRVSDTECELRQPPTHTHFLESVTRFRFHAPDVLDMEFACTPTQHAFARGFIALFWASYIHAPLDKSMHFLGGADDGPALWQQLCTPTHNHASTVRGREDTLELTFAPDAPDALYKNFSPLRFELPVCYGRFEDLTWIVMLDPEQVVRLTHSPSGGGADPARRTTNPAWDFQFIIPEYDVMETYTLRVRTILRRECSRDDVLREYEAWKASLR